MSLFPRGSTNSLKPRKAQIASITSVANPIRADASQNGVIPSRATSMTRNVAPQTRPSVTTISQLCAVISGFFVLYVVPRPVTGRLTSRHATRPHVLGRKATKGAIHEYLSDTRSRSDHNGNHRLCCPAQQTTNRKAASHRKHSQKRLGKRRRSTPQGTVIQCDPAPQGRIIFVSQRFENQFFS